MGNFENFEKLGKKNQAKKIFNLADKILLDLDIGERSNLLADLQKLDRYLKIHGKLSSLEFELNKILTNFDSQKQNPIKNLLLEIRNNLSDKIGLSNFESDYINYTKYGNSVKKLNNFVVIVDNIRSPFNVGSIIRSAEAFGFSIVILYGISSKLPLEKIYRTSMNAEKLIEIVFIDNIDELTSFLKKENFKLVILEKRKGSQNLWEVKITDKIALVIGNEEFGVSEDILERADLILEIPQFGTKNVINVASAFSIAAAYLSYNYKN
ncbi:MAG: hypothetical protein NUV32_02155 [Exilispira sp.]|jgi:tRNA G18 (ribose-2'-O)-methylase SpoU|nr:hypothetical protein [Exilispira sp.]